MNLSNIVQCDIFLCHSQVGESSCRFSLSFLVFFYVYLLTQLVNKAMITLICKLKDIKTIKSAAYLGLS